jgi:hypothetical protein
MFLPLPFMFLPERVGQPPVQTRDAHHQHHTALSGEARHCAALGSIPGDAECFHFGSAHLQDLAAPGVAMDTALVEAVVSHHICFCCFSNTARTCYDPPVLWHGDDGKSNRVVRVPLTGGVTDKLSMRMHTTHADLHPCLEHMMSAYADLHPCLEHMMSA